MNLKEILLALIDGKKIRHKGWGKDEYIYYYNGKDFIDENWELYEKPKKPIDEINEEYKKYNENWENDDPVGVITAIVKYLNDKEGGK